jgi:hypothetical protein
LRHLRRFIYGASLFVADTAPDEVLSQVAQVTQVETVPVTRFQKIAYPTKLARKSANLS